MEWARATSGKEVERPLLKALGGLEPRTSPHPRSERQLVATGGSRARLSLCRFRRPARRSLAARRLESKKLGDEESDQPDRRRVAGVGSEEHGEKGRSDNKARDARPPQRHSRGGRQDVHRLLLARAPVRRSCLERREPLGKTRRSAAMQKRNLRVSFTWMPAPSVFGWREQRERQRAILEQAARHFDAGDLRVAVGDVPSGQSRRGASGPRSRRGGRKSRSHDGLSGFATGRGHGTKHVEGRVCQRAPYTDGSAASHSMHSIPSNAERLVDTSD